jgi:ribose 5-phosphate isomerase B
MHLVFGSDHAGYALKEALKQFATDQWPDVVLSDVGCFDAQHSADYPGIAQEAVRRMLSLDESAHPAQVRGVLCCGSGIGVAIAANRQPRIRAVTVHNHASAEMSRRHNDTNVICFGQRYIAAPYACDLLALWMETAFDGERHLPRVTMLEQC